jgi:hypothetical protein
MPCRVPLHRLEFCAHGEIGQRRAGRERLRIDVIEIQRRALQWHLRERRRLDARVARQLHARCVELGNQRFERTRQMRAHLNGFVVDLARIASVARQRKRPHAV